MSSVTSSPPPPSRASYEPAMRRSDSFYMHQDEDSFYTSRKSSTDIEAGCLVPSDDDIAVPDLTANKSRRGSIYAAYRRWFARGSPHASGTVQLGEKVEQRRAWILERRLQTGSWCAMVVLLLLTIYFLIHEA
ncbi:hypothetical protein B0H11DRAFT_2219151 [Mycena galericulata]|nr:hypothetical protein B0H11DRAFT_2219151 [Mycena galericulata]